MNRLSTQLQHKLSPSTTKLGISDTKRNEVRFLILEGYPHAEVVTRSGVSSGTVSVIRKEIRELIPLYRNSESGICARFACRAGASSTFPGSQPIENTGGPGRTRTCDQTVMSGQL